MTWKRLTVLAAVAAISFASGGWLLQRRSGDAAAVYRQARLFDDVVAHLADYYVDSLSERELYRMAIEGMLGEIGDPYSVFMEREEYDQLNESTTGNYGGLGIQIDVRDGWITVVAPLPDTPAERAGIQSGDRIIELDGGSTRDWNIEKAVQELRGKPGTVANLTIARIGVSEPIEVPVERAEIHVRSVQATMMLDDRVGYVWLNPVSASSREELEAEIERLRASGLRALVLDLRDNPGGLLDQGVDVADMFLDSGEEIVAVRGRAPGMSQTFRDRRRQQWPDLPIVVLVNDYTASAAEIIAGALQDHDRAMIVGTPTFGKGLVQSLFRLTPNEWLKLTTGRWYTPSGRSIQAPRASGGDPLVARRAAGQPSPDPESGAAAAPVVERADTFRTAAGRPVSGGGGIVPDTIVRPDTLTDGEREFVRRIGAGMPVYYDVITSYAIELAEQGLVAPDFETTPATLREVLVRMRARGIEMDEATFMAAQRWVGQRLAHQALRYGHGRQAEFRRRLQDDAQAQAAIRLLDGVRSPRELLGLGPGQR